MEFSYNTKRTKKYRHGSKEKSKIASRNIVFKMNSLPKTSFFRTAWCVILAVFKAMREVVSRLTASGGSLLQKQRSSTGSFQYRIS